MIQRFEHGGNIYTENSRDLLDYSANINPLGLSDIVRQTVMAHIDDLVHYPDPEGRELKKALAGYYHLPQECLILGNGAAELLYLYMQWYHPKQVLIPVPSFSEYERAALSVRAVVTYARLRPEYRFQPDLDELLNQAFACDCIILGNPNNPTGNLIRRDELVPFLEKSEQADKAVIIDESFLDFRDDAVRYSVADLTEQFPHLFVIHSLTKFYALPGLRLGFGVLPPEGVTGLSQQTDVWHVNTLAQKAGAAAINDKIYQHRSRLLIRKAGMQLRQGLEKFGWLTLYGPTVNFLLCQLPEREITAAILAERMRNHHILIRDCSNYPGLDRYYFRLAVRLEEENAYVIRTLKKCLCG